ncbi:MAG: hypothetical protein AMXMBFR16_13180 [Candidatus Uhrbacteria bacterium]
MSYSVSVVNGRVAVNGRGGGFYVNGKTELDVLIAELSCAGNEAFADVVGRKGLDVRAEFDAIALLVRDIPEVTDRRNIRFRLLEQLAILESEYPTSRDTDLLMIETCLTFLSHLRELPGLRKYPFAQDALIEADARLRAVYAELRV